MVCVLQKPLFPYVLVQGSIIILLHSSLASALSFWRRGDNQWRAVDLKLRLGQSLSPPTTPRAENSIRASNAAGSAPQPRPFDSFPPNWYRTLLEEGGNVNLPVSILQGYPVNHVPFNAQHLQHEFPASQAWQHSRSAIGLAGGNAKIVATGVILPGEDDEESYQPPPRRRGKGKAIEYSASQAGRGKSGKKSEENSETAPKLLDSQGSEIGEKIIQGNGRIDSRIRPADALLYDAYGNPIQKPLHWHLILDQALGLRLMEPTLKRIGEARGKGALEEGQFMTRSRWYHYWNNYLFRPSPSFVSQGAFFPSAARAFQERIDHLIALKLALLKHTSYEFSPEERDILNRRFRDWRLLKIYAANDGFPIMAPLKMIIAADEDKDLLHKLEVLLHKVASKLRPDVHG